MSIKERIAKLIDVKSITTVLLTIAFIVLLFVEIPIDETMEKKQKKD